MMVRRIIIASSSFLMIWGLVVLSWGFRDLPIDQRPEWMNWEMVLWPVIVLGIAEFGRLVRYVRKGFQVHADRFKLAMHGFPALIIALAPVGTFTNIFGAQSLWALLDFPTAKVMAALWLAFTLWTAWEVDIP
ncbi:MAG: hypothetical protein M1596_06345 [Firmicutes bacterium]|nr:hypothetical protein [Bacillota bacterium]